MVRFNQNDLRHKVQDMVLEVIGYTLGPQYATRESRQLHARGPTETHLQIYHILSNVLTFSPASRFWWTKLGKPFGSMLETSNYSLQAQCRFLCFFYGSVIGLMGPHDSPSPGSMMTIDGSPVELSWVLPQSDGPGSAKNSQKQPRHREVRFAIEPMHPVTGRRLKGSVVLDYLTSPQGSLGMISTAEDGMEWRRKTESFLFPHAEDEDEEIPDGSRFFVGFDFAPNGTISLKAYYLPAPSSSLDASLQENSAERPLRLWDVNYDPLRRLVHELDPDSMEPLELLLSYFESLEDRHKPRIQILAMDCVQSSQNRLKIYCRPKEGSSWSDAVRSFTLGGRLQSTEMDGAIAHMRRLWDHLFPGASSSSDLELSQCVAKPHSGNDTTNTGEKNKIKFDIAATDGNGIKLNEARHPVDGLLYYYSLHPGKNCVYPKIYLPVTQYCRDDLMIARSVEHFLTEVHQLVGDSLAQRASGSAARQDWVAEEVSNAFNHRSLGERTGVHTYVTFALKKRGWELTNYFSPEIYGGA